MKRFGIQHTLKGWAALGLSDDEIIAKGSESFDALYAILSRQK